MNKLLAVAGRRTAGLAAGVILTGGLAGGVLLAPTAAYATTPPVTTTTSITASVSPTFHGATLTASVSVTPTSNVNGVPGGTVQVSGGGGGCSATLNSAGAGSCQIFNVPDGPYTLTASYAASALFGGSSSSTSGTIGPVFTAPVFVADSPSLSATAGQSYSADFRAVGSPGISYSLSGPSWLHIDSFSGSVWGTVPFYGRSFTYSVTATNHAGSATAGPYTVWVQQQPQRRFHSRVTTFLSCTSRVFTGTRGSCTLWVTDRGNGSVPNVTAQIALPSQLRADYCNNSFFFFGCSISNNTATENLGTLYPGQTKQLTVVFTARTGLGIWGWHHGFHFTVKVVGSASSFGGFPFFFNGTSFSTAYVTIIPRGWWAA
jgi:hypothetical protein